VDQKVDAERAAHVQYLPWTYMPIDDVCVAIGKCGVSTLYDKVKRKEFPPPDRIAGRSLWRSDIVARWLEEQARKADAEREERTKAAREKADRMVRARAV